MNETANKQELEQAYLDQQTLLLLIRSQSPDPGIHRQVQQELNDFNALPKFNLALARIFSNPETANETIRALAGLLLKNNIRIHYANFPKDLTDIIKTIALELLGDPSYTIRRTTTTLIATIAAYGELSTWQELLPMLTNLIISPNELVAVSAFEAVEKICEDMAEVLCTADMGSIIDAMLAGFVELFYHPNPGIRLHAVTSVQYFVPFEHNGIINNLEKYVKGLFHLANDTSYKTIKRQVCKSINAVYETRPEALAPYLDDVIHFMKVSSGDEDQDVALEACEFWLAITDNSHGREVLAKHLGDLIPFLLQKMRYSEDEILDLALELGDDCLEPDKDDDIKPLFARSKGGIASGDSNSEANDDDDDDYDDDDSNNVWNIRRCAAASLDYIAHAYGGDILTTIFPILQETIVHQDWIVKEASILTFGAIAEGCMASMEPNLPTLIPYFVDSLHDKHPLVRSITCWTLSRYTGWIIEKPQERHFAKVLNGFLSCIIDNNKRVQESACSAFATMAEAAGMELVPYLDSILTVLVQAFAKYQHKNLLNLYDAIGTMASAIKHHLNQPKYIDVLMPPIIQKWNTLNDDDQDLFPLLECLSSIAVAMGPGFLPYCEGVFKRCLSLVEQVLQQDMAFRLDPANTEMPNKDFMIAALDLISGLAEGLKENITNLISSSNILELTIRCTNDTLPEAHQSAFALIGDVTKACFHLVQPHLPQIMEALARNLKVEHVSVCNNVTWALGEIAIKLGSDMRPYLNNFTSQLLKNINQPSIPRTLLDNTAISLGRIALVCPEELAPHLNEFIKPWCTSVRSIRDNDAKDSAFRGICELIKRNPTAVVEDFSHICDAIVCWDDPKQDLKQVFYELLHSFKNHIGDQAWQQYREQFHPDIKQKMLTQYGI